ncbi:MAG: phosphopantothenoylcysteine decarboxylase [Candidatus Omnitrophota bacterium]|nr:phosphopantothenoylcysteine decarboxylase [Candidatus Omnitrophota bacterium]
MTLPKTILITSGPTREFIDPVRFISNLSTGTMGYQLAREARARNFKVILISGPTGLTPLKNVRFIPITTALQMRRMVKKFFSRVDCLIMTAAVSDYRTARSKPEKIKAQRPLTLRFVRNPDILGEISKHKGKKILVGFSLETRDLIKNARLKLKKKGLDFIVANKAGGRCRPFGDNKVSCMIIDKFENEKRLKNISKKKLSSLIFDKISAIEQA